MAAPLDVLIVAQAGRLAYEALLFAASLADSTPAGHTQLWVAEPQPGPLWPSDPRLPPEIRAELQRMGAQILPFENRHFGATYPQGNKIEALLALPPGRPFVFFDTDTLILSDLARVPFDFDRPSASLRVEGTWPKPDLYGPQTGAIWQALYARFDLPFQSSLDLAQPHDHWRRYLYFNAGVFYHRCPQIFGQRFLEIALSIRDDTPPELLGQSLTPWLDQIALPLVIHGLGGGRDTLAPGHLDGTASCHYRALPLLYARESDHVVATLERLAAPNRLKKLLKHHEPFRRYLYQGRGARARALFDRSALPSREQVIRQKLKKAGLWMR